MKTDKKKMEESVEAGKTSRREFFLGIWKILGLVALAETAILVVSMLRPGKKFEKENPGASVKTVGNVDDFAVNSVTADRVNKYYLVRNNDGAFLALSLMCSHLGCSVLWDDAKKQFLCPCHSSAFDRNGSVINSPAPAPLDYFPVIIEGGKVKIDLNQKKKRHSFEKSQLTYAL